MARRRPNMNEAIRARAGRLPADEASTRATTTKGTPTARKGTAAKPAAKAVPREDVEERPAVVLDFEEILQEVSAMSAEDLPAEIEAAEEDLAGLEEEVEEIRTRRDEGLARAAAMRARLDALDGGDEDGGEE